MESIEEILIRRDGLSASEAKELVSETKLLILASNDITEVDQIMAEKLGLEPDYIMQLFGA